MTNPHTTQPKSSLKNTRGYAAVGLYKPKTPENVGAAIRAAYCYGAVFVAQSGVRYEGSALDTAKGHRHLPLLTVDSLINTIPHDCVGVAVDLLPNARSLVDYTHPERALYVFGPEDGTLPAELVEHCKDVVYVPTRYCMNLAATVNVVLYDRLAKT
jgi:tRNA(Leu) C34 or U34 (ribose-2'-O)-methylase TrmL